MKEILKNKDKNKLIFTILACGLVVIITISYTYSFFAVTKTNSAIIAGEAESLGLTVVVDQLAPEPSSDLIPQMDDYIEEAITGRQGSCVDDNGNSVCHTYKITVTNSNVTTKVNGTLTLDKKQNPNLKWAVYNLDGESNPSLVGDIKTPVDTDLITNEEFAAGETKEFYIVVWISESGMIQTDKGEYSGVIDFATTNDIEQALLSKYTIESSEKITANTATFLSTPIQRKDIESIEFINTGDAPQNSINVYDVSELKDNSVLLYYTDNDSDNLYEVKIGTETGTTSSNSGYYLFSFMTNLTSIDVTNLDTSKMTTMYSMFDNCTSLKILNASNFNTSKVTDMNGMFYKCSSLTSLDISNFNTSKVTDMSYMFGYNEKLLTIDLSSFDTSNVTKMGGLFQECSSLENINVSNFNTSKVTDMHGMFYNCNSIASLDVSNFNTSKVTDMSYMFAGYERNMSLTNIIGLENFDTSNVTDMQSMFQRCRNIKVLYVSNFNTSKVANMQSMFWGCDSLTSLDLSNFSTLQVKNMKAMFENCSSLITIYASNNFITNSVTSSNSMFDGCTSLVGENGTTFNSSYIDKTYARIDAAGTPGYFTLNSS